METPRMSSSHGYENKDFKLVGLLYATIALLVLLVVVVFVLKPLFAFRVAQHVVTNPDAAVTQVFPQPKLQPQPARDWVEFHAAEVKQLTTYGWVDRSRNIVRVPVKEAMIRYLARQEAAMRGERTTP